MRHRNSNNVTPTGNRLYTRITAIDRNKKTRRKMRNNICFSKFEMGETRPWFSATFRYLRPWENSSDHSQFMRSTRTFVNPSTASITNRRLRVHTRLVPPPPRKVGKRCDTKTQKADEQN